MFEAFAMLLMKESPVSKVAKVLVETDQRLWRILIHYVNEAHAKKDWSQCTRILIDETSARRGHRYVTSFLDALTGEILLMVEGKGHETVAEFVKEMRLHGSSPEQVQWIGIDMSRAFQKGVRDCFPSAEIVFDRFHVMQLAGKMLDEIRKAIHREFGLVKGARRALMGNEWNLTDEQDATRKELCHLYPTLGKAMEIRDRLQDAYEEKSESLLKLLYRSASHCKNKEIQKLARSIKEHWDGIVSFFKTNLSNGKIEAINGIIQLAKRNARGFRNFEYLRAISYLRCSKLQLNLPAL
jgi:transposase